MKFVVLTKEEGPEMREAIELAERIRDGGYQSESYDVQDFEAESMIRVYDIMKTPTAFITEDDGRLVEIWQGEIPTENEVLNFMRL